MFYNIVLAFFAEIIDFFGLNNIFATKHPHK
jgi:hypothetical protein